MTSHLRFSDSQPEDTLASQTKSLLAQLQYVENFEADILDEYLSANKAPENWKTFLKESTLPKEDYRNDIPQNAMIGNGPSYPYISVSPVAFIQKEQYVVSGQTPEKHRTDFLKNFNWKNVVLAGGCVSRALLNDSSGDFDYDFYIYGLKPSEARRRLAELIEYFANFHMVRVNPIQNGHLRFIRTTTAITLNWGFGPRNVQICLTLTRDPLELILSFDIAPSKLFFDGTNIWLSPSAHLAYKTGVFGLGRNTERLHSVTLNKRVNKYVQRGFSAVRLAPGFESIVVNPGIPVPVPDNIYNVIDLNEIIFEGKEGTQELAVERTFAEKYHANPRFIAMRYKDILTYKNRTRLDVGICWSIVSLSAVWYFLDHAQLYLQHLRETSRDDAGEFDFWSKAPDPLIPNRIEFITVDRLMVYVKSTRS